MPEQFQNFIYKIIDDLQEIRQTLVDLHRSQNEKKEKKSYFFEKNT